MKKIISIMLILILCISTNVSAETKIYDHSGDIPKGDIANFYDYPIAQNATRITPWFVRWARQKQAEYDTGVRGQDGNQRIQTISVSPVNPDHMLFGSDMAGIWRSTDGGINWETIGGNNNNWCVNDSMWSPYDENVAFTVQTGSKSASVDKANNSQLDGLYKTTDAGKTWKQVLAKNFLSTAGSSGLVQYDKNGNIIALSSEGVYKSKDDGETWELIDGTIVPENAIVYTMHLFDGNSKEMLIGITGGLYYTSNGGLIWENITPDIEGIANCACITVDPDDNNHWMAIFHGLKKVLYETKDGGKTWTPISYRVNSEGSATPWIVKYVKKTDGVNRLFLIYNMFGSNFHYSDDDGKNWKSKTLIDRHLVYNNAGNGYYCEGFAVDTANPGTVYYSFADFVYKSTDYGETFYANNGGFSAINTRRLVFDQEGRILFCDVDRGLAMSNEPYKKGEYSTVERIITTTECSAAAVDPNDINHIFAFCGGLKESFDRGKTWNKIEGFAGDFATLKYHSKTKNFIYAGNKYSKDNGKTWKDLSYTITTVSPANNDVVYSFTGGMIYKSKNKGIDWEEVTRASAYTVVADCFDEDTVWYGGYSGTINKVEGTMVTTFNGENGLYTDKGAFVSITAIAQNPKNKNHLIAGGKETNGGLKTPGVFETLDGGNTWELVPGMKGIAHITSITFSPFSEEAFIGTCSNGFIIYDYNIFRDWYNGKLTSWDMSDEYIIPNMYKDGRIRVKIDSDVIGFDSQPFLENDRTFVPMRKIFEKLGATIEWDDATQTVTGTKDKTVVKLTIGSEIATINGVEKTLDAVPQLRNDRTMIPLRFVAEALGCKVDWSDSNNLVIIKSK